MTQRLYYDDAYTANFTARVVERLRHEDRPAVVLDRTFFYPTGGGQPGDLGTLGNIPVVATLTREGDAAVVHVLAESIEADEVQGVIDWARRFDHMQHHTGQHILTQAFVQTVSAHTVGFHLSADTVTIDLDAARLTPADVSAAEDLANRIVYENRVVSARLIDPEQTDGVRMRRMPGHLATDGLRVIDIERFDVTACGGTHVARTGEIGMIKIIKVEKRGDKTRVEFRCGGRALRDYREKNSIVSALSADLTCAQSEITQAVSRLKDELKEAQRSAKALSNQIIGFEVDRLLSAAPMRDGVRIIKAAFENRDAGELRILAGRLVEPSGVVALVGTSGEKAHLVFARSADLAQDMNALLKQALASLGEARGGGPPNLAQGGGVKATIDQVRAALDEAERSL